MTKTSLITLSRDAKVASIEFEIYSKRDKSNIELIIELKIKFNFLELLLKSEDDKNKINNAMRSRFER